MSCAWCVSVSVVCQYYCVTSVMGLQTGGSLGEGHSGRGLTCKPARHWWWGALGCPAGGGGNSLLSPENSNYLQSVCLEWHFLALLCAVCWWSRLEVLGWYVSLEG